MSPQACHVSVTDIEPPEVGLDIEPLFPIGVQNSISDLSRIRLARLCRRVRAQISEPIIESSVIYRLMGTVPMVDLRLETATGAHQLEILAIGHVDLEDPALLMVPDPLDAIYLAALLVDMLRTMAEPGCHLPDFSKWLRSARLRAVSGLWRRI